MKQQSPKRQKRVFPLEKTMGAALQRRDKSLIGAGDEARTRDLLLGKQTLYQLSYSRL